MKDKKILTIGQYIDKHGFPKAVILHKDNIDLKPIFENAGIEVHIKPEWDFDKKMILMGMLSEDLRMADTGLDQIDMFNN